MYTIRYFARAQETQQIGMNDKYEYFGEPAGRDKDNSCVSGILRLHFYYHIYIVYLD